MNNDLGWETIQCRADILGLNIFHKIHVKETRPLIRKCMPEMNWDRRIFLRHKGGYTPFSSKSEKFLKSFFPYFSKLWNSIDNSITGKNLQEFKIYTKTLKPVRVKHFSRGNKLTNSQLTRIRVGRSDLNQHKFTVGLVESPACLCHCKEESPKHFFIDCFLYTQERDCLFKLIGHYIPKFNKMNKTEQLNIILFGLNFENSDFSHLNTIITKAVQNYIRKTKRFE